MKILICDDIKKETEHLAALLVDEDISVFQSGADALEYIRAGAVVDVCILDIVMPEMNGMALAEQLRSDGWVGKVVFLSTSSEFGPQSYRVGAFDYLLKPPTPDSLKALLDRLKTETKNMDTRSILLKTRGVSRSMLFRELSYAEAMRDKVIFNSTDGGKLEVGMTFADAARELLSDQRFVQCHRSYIVNMDEIAEISESQLFTRNRARIPISRGYGSARETYYMWKFGGGRK